MEDRKPEQLQQWAGATDIIQKWRDAEMSQDSALADRLPLLEFTECQAEEAGAYSSGP